MINRYINILILILFVGLGLQPAYAQYETRADSIAASDQFYETGQLILKETSVVTQAREMFESAANLNPDNIWANYMTGKTYLETINKERASQYFERVYALDPNFRYDILYSIGRGYQYGLHFEEALDYFNQYKEKTLNDVNYRGKDKVQLREVEQRIAECQNGQEYVKNPKHYAIVNVNQPKRMLWAT